MNLELLRTFDQSYPEHNDGILDSGSEAVVCQFNRRGTLLAVGCNDGRVAIWDFMTRGIARQLSSHIHPITSLSWNRSGRKLLSASTDWNVILWDVYSGEAELRLRLPSPVTRVQYNPRDKNMFLICPMKNVPTIVTLKGAESPVHSLLPTCGEPEANMAGSFDRRGKLIILGTSRGKVIIIDANTLSVLKYYCVYSSTSASISIKSIEFARRGSTFLINGSDRVMRVYEIDDIMKAKGSGCGLEVEIEALQRLQDNVNRTQWKICVFSGDGDYICAGSHRQHELYIWDKSTGNLVKILTGPKGECLLDISWHPAQAIILSVSNGIVNVWAQKQKELWSAYAPNFKELDENEEYEETEEEFDIEDEDSSINNDQQIDIIEDNNINITDNNNITAFCSSDEDYDDPPLDWLPFAPEVDEPDEPGWGQLEPSLNEDGKSPNKRNATTDENIDPALKPSPNVDPALKPSVDIDPALKPSLNVDSALKPPDNKKLKVVDIELPEATIIVSTVNDNNNNKGRKTSKDTGKKK